jgi:hypothetical protein
MEHSEPEAGIFLAVGKEQEKEEEIFGKVKATLVAMCSQHQCKPDNDAINHMTEDFIFLAKQKDEDPVHEVRMLDVFVGTKPKDPVLKWSLRLFLWNVTGHRFMGER